MMREVDELLFRDVSKEWQVKDSQILFPLFSNLTTYISSVHFVFGSNDNLRLTTMMIVVVMMEGQVGNAQMMKVVVLDQGKRNN